MFRQRALLLAAAAAIQILPCLGHAGVCSRPNFYKRLKLSLERDFSRGFDATMIQPVHSTQVTTSADVARMIPAEALQPGSDGGRVAQQILDRSVRSWLQSDHVKKNDLVRSAASIEEVADTRMGFGGDEPDSIQHNFKFAVRPTQSRATLNYTGITTAVFSYRASDSKFDVEVREPMNDLGTDLVFNHISEPNDQREIMSMRWSW